MSEEEVNAAVDAAFAEFLRDNPQDPLPDVELSLRREALLDELKRIRDAAIRKRADTISSPGRLG